MVVEPSGLVLSVPPVTVATEMVYKGTISYTAVATALLTIFSFTAMALMVVVPLSVVAIGSV